MYCSIKQPSIWQPGFNKQERLCFHLGIKTSQCNKICTWKLNTKKGILANSHSYLWKKCNFIHLKKLKQYILIVVTSLDTCKAEIRIWCGTQKLRSLHKSNAPSFLHPRRRLWRLHTKRKPSRKGQSAAHARMSCSTTPSISDEQPTTKASRRNTVSPPPCISKANTKP